MSDQTPDSLLDLNLDDLADLPEFKVFPAGAHRCTISFESKKIGDHPAIEIKLRLIETVEFADPNEAPMEAGTESSCAYMLDNEFGQGNFKKLAVVLGQHFGLSRVPEIIEAAKGAEVLAVTKVRTNKDKTQNYLDIVKLEVL